MTYPKPVRAKKLPKPLTRGAIASRKRPQVIKTGRKSLPELRKTMDAITSKIVRIRGILPGYHLIVPCYTCAGTHSWKDMDAGHFISRAVWRTRWNFDNLRPQCTACNRHRQGQPHIFRRNLVNEIGRPAVEELEALAADPTPWWGEREWLEENIPVRKAMLKELEGKLNGNA